MNSDAVVLTGDEVTLREWSEADLPQMIRLFDDPEIAYRTPLVTPFDPEAAHAYLSAIRRASGRRLHLTITTADDLPRGEVMLNRATGSVAYLVGAPYRGQGLAARALGLLVAYATDVVGLPSTHLEIEADNVASIAVAKRAGFRRSADAAPEPVEDKGRSYTLFRWVKRH